MIHLPLVFLIFIILLITTLSLVKPIQYVTRKRWYNSPEFIEQNDTWRIYNNSNYCFEARNALPYEITLLSIGLIYIAVQFICTFYFSEVLEKNDMYIQSWTKVVTLKSLRIPVIKTPGSPIPCSCSLKYVLFLITSIIYKLCSSHGIEIISELQGAAINSTARKPIVLQ